MTDISLTPPATYADLATWLHSIADQISTVDGDGLAEPSAIYLSILPASTADEPARVAAVDALCLAILGRPGQQEPTPSGKYHHSGRGYVGLVEVSIHTSIAGPSPDEVAAELIRLRAENAHMRRELDGDGFDDELARVAHAALSPDSVVA